MRILIICITLLSIGCPCLNAKEIDFETLYSQLDDAIAHSQKYVAVREGRISSLKRQLNTKDAKQQMNICHKLYDEYKAYKNDSAIAYIKRCIRLSEKLGMKNKTAEYLCECMLQSSVAGYYPEALQLLSRIHTADLDRHGLSLYYRATNHLYGEMAFYTNDHDMQQEFYRKANIFRDSIFSTYPHNDNLYLQKKEDQLIAAKKYREALSINDKWLNMVRKDSHEYAIVTFFRQQLYSIIGQNDMTKYWLAKSAIADIHNAIMDQASLWTLADRLSKEGDTERSFNYISFAWKASQTFNTRIRSWLISPILSNIDNNYQKGIYENNRNLKVFITVISLLVVLLVFLLFYVNKQRRRIAMGRNELKKINDELEHINHELYSANEQLEKTNLKLDESNRVKEEYIGRFIGICSLYIDKMDDYRKKVNKLLRNREFTELAEITKNAEFKEKEMDELYANFDAVFIHLFPTFVEDFNQLLKEPNRIHLSDQKKLNTILRIFALIRLGIDDSVKISEFLNYSLNTIYNYRAKMRNAALGNRDDFEGKVKTLGTLPVPALH